MGRIPPVSFSHVGIFVRDIDRMGASFYTGAV